MYPYFGQTQPMPWQAYQQPRQVMPQQRQGIVRVSGIESFANMQAEPNTEFLALHQNEPIMFLCQSDGVGKVTATAFDITTHRTEEQKITDKTNERITALEETVARMEVILNAKSDTSNADVKQTDASNRPCPANDASGSNGWQSRSGSATNGK